LESPCRLLPVPGGAFLGDPLLDRILTAPEKDLHIRRIMDQGRVLLVNLAKGHIGEDSSSLLGGLLVTTIGLGAFSRADTPPAERRDFFVYIDEFQSFTTLALANMLSELRKYRVGFTVAHQYTRRIRCFAATGRFSPGGPYNQSTQTIFLRERRSVCKGSALTRV
jgi:hypothetical protein